MVKTTFQSAPIPFTYDSTDPEHCTLNDEINEIINETKLTLPIVHIKGTSRYLLGTKLVTLKMQFPVIHVIEDDKESTTIGLREYIDQNQKAFER